MFGKKHDFRGDKSQSKKNKFLLFFVKDERLYITMAAVMAAVILGWEWLCNKNVDSVIEFSTFSAVVIESILVFVVSRLRSYIMNQVEDPNKLTTDYDGLVKRYSLERNFVTCKNSDGVAVIPVILEAKLYDKKIGIEDHPEKNYSLPEIIEKHYEDLFSAHVTSKIYNNTNIRIDEWGCMEDSDTFKFVTGRTTYYNSLVTNRAMDYSLADGISVRELLECGPMVHSLKNSSLSNHLGFNGFVESSDGSIMLVYRKKNVSIAKRTYSDSVGASLKVKYALNETYIFTVEGLENGIIKEIKDELGIEKDTLEAVQNTSGLKYVQLIAAYRDMLEGGKPQLLFYAKTSMSQSEIEAAFYERNNQIKKAPGQYGSDADKKEMETDGDKLVWISVSELPDWDVYSDGIRCRKNGKEEYLKMVPSASACVEMLKEYMGL